MKPAGALVGLTYDAVADVEPGDYIRTTTGRTYRVETERRVRSTKHPHRRRLLATVMPDGHDVEPDAVVHEIVWYRR